MPRYYFNLYDDAVIIDDEGVDLPDLASVKEHALLAARELACQDLKNGKLRLRHRIEIVDEERRPVLSLPFSAAFEIVD